MMPTTPQTPAIAAPLRFDVDAFERMWQHGILDEDGRYELIEGEVFVVPPAGQPHCGCVNRLTEALVLRCHGRAVVHVQNPLILDATNWFLPDLALLRPREDFYSSKRVRAEDVLLAVEVADTSLRQDRERKAPVYARTGTPELWIVDLRGSVVWRYSGLDGGTYRVVEELRGAAQLTIPVAEAGALTADQILGCAPGD